MSSTIKVLLDSTYLLPSFGIEILGLTDNDIIELREQALKNNVKFYCMTASWTEIIGKVCREAEHHGIDLCKLLNTVLPSILEYELYTWINPSTEAVKLAFKLRMLGHKDNIDNLLYATATVNNMVFLTMDDEFKGFLKKHGLEVNNVKNHVQLIQELRNRDK